jgi:SHS2 domain-containing protein
MPYRVLDHTADFMVEVWGADFAEVAADGARALFDIITDTKTVRGTSKVPVQVQADTYEQLLVAWLTELLFLYETELWLFSRFEFKRAGEGIIEAHAWGEKLDPERHPIDREVKAVTYHRLVLERKNDRLRATIVFDL